MTTAMWLILAVGVFAGWFIGRWWAEVKRANYDMDKTWQARRNYRDD
jgi:hypothetical protein